MLILIFFSKSYLNSDENEADASTSKSTKHDFSEMRNLYRDDELISLCIERYW